MAINISRSTRFGPNVVRDGLVLYVDNENTKSWPGSGSVWQDMSPSRIAGSVSGGISAFGSSMTWSNNIDYITINAVLEKTGDIVGYANHPINKWNAGYNNNASFILYHFGTTSGENGNVRFLGNNTAQNSSGWTSISSGYVMSIGQTVFLSLQYSYLTGGQLWINGSKSGTRVGIGRLGQTSINSTVSDLIIHGPSGVSGQHIVHLCQIYSRELTDAEVVQSYNAIGSRFGI